MRRGVSPQPPRYREMAKTLAEVKFYTSAHDLGDGDSDTSPALTRVACDSHAGPARATILWKPPSRHTQPQSPSTDTVAKRLKRWTRNPLDSARRGSNPLGVAFYRMMLDMNSLSPVGWSSLTFKPVICRLRSAAKEKQGAGWARVSSGRLCSLPNCTASRLDTLYGEMRSGRRIARCADGYEMRHV